MWPKTVSWALVYSAETFSVLRGLTRLWDASSRSTSLRREATGSVDRESRRQSTHTLHSSPRRASALGGRQSSGEKAEAQVTEGGAASWQVPPASPLEGRCHTPVAQWGSGRSEPQGAAGPVLGHPELLSGGVGPHVGPSRLVPISRSQGCLFGWALGSTAC